MERASGATMYCKNCGTVNPEIADYCLKCGRRLGDAFGGEAEAASPVEITLAARASSSAYSGTKKSFVSRTIVAAIAASLLVIVAGSLLLAQTGGAVYHPQGTDGVTATGDQNADSSQSVTGAPGFRGLGLAPGPSPVTLANDAVRKTNALRLQTAVAQFYAENDRYPSAISEIPPQMLGFEADRNIYKYSVRQNPYGFRIEVIMEGNNVSGGHMVTEGDVTKYVYEGQ